MAENVSKRKRKTKDGSVSELLYKHMGLNMNMDPHAVRAETERFLGLTGQSVSSQFSENPVSKTIKMNRECLGC